MNIFTQLTLIVGRITPSGVVLLGTGFLVSNDGKIATVSHTVGHDEKNIVVLLPHISDLNEYQDLTDTSCKPIPATISEIDPIKDICILKADLTFTGTLPRIGSFDEVPVGEEVGIFGYPHCVQGRRSLTFQKTIIGAKVLISSNGVKTKHAVINTQARPGQSGSLVFSPTRGATVGILVGAYAPAGGGISLGGINPHELHQTTHCISAHYLKEMI